MDWAATPLVAGPAALMLDLLGWKRSTGSCL